MLNSPIIKKTVLDIVGRRIQYDYFYILFPPRLYFVLQSGVNGQARRMGGTFGL